jgi:hypothetical protein
MRISPFDLKYHNNIVHLSKNFVQKVNVIIIITLIGLILNTQSGVNSGNQLCFL